MASAAITVALAAGVAACGESDGGSGLSAAGERGRQLSLTNGCAACHGADGQGGVGPTWIDLPGSEVELADGTIIIADDDYLVRSIAQPAADLLAGYFVQMPRNDLDDSEIADVIAYIKDLSSEGSVSSD